MQDLERNDGSEEKPYYMSKDLLRVLNKENKSSRPSSPDNKWQNDNYVTPNDDGRSQINIEDVDEEEIVPL